MSLGSCECDNARVETATPQQFDRLDVPRSLLLGTCLSLASRWRARVGVVRLGFLVLGLAGGAGVGLYLLASVLSGRRLAPEAHNGAADGETEPTMRANLAVALFTAAALFTVTSAVPWLPAVLLWAVLLVTFGLVLGTPSGRMLAGGRSPSTARVVLGSAFVVAGIVTVLASTQDLSQLWRSLVAAVVMVGGIAVVIGPWIGQAMQVASDERTERIRAEERADVAAHLHDSVLQTLSLIQNRAGEPQVIAALAHQQERELRRWLYSHRDTPPRDTTRDAPASSTLRDALDDLASEIESQYLVVIECITVGDTELSPPVVALLAATREALVNAAKFANTQLISVYAEVLRPAESIHGPAVSLYVRDRGSGFDLATVTPDRHGIADSIVGRVERVGGTASVRSSAGVGTEVQMAVPL